MNHLFLSDVHLGALSDKSDRNVRHDLAELIRFCSEQNIMIHIHGDLFDYWMEYPGWKPELGKDILECFSDYMDKHGAINYVTGNHDNWTNGYFVNLGFNISHDFFDLSLNGKRIFLHHGDGLSDPEMNLPRPPFHRLLRNKFFVKLYQRVLPPRAGISTMKAFSNYSKRRAYCDPSVLDNWAKNFLENSAYNVVISGHDHHPRIREYEFGTYINTGTFFKHRTVGLYNNGQLQLVSWDATNKTFEQYGNSLQVTLN
jgi:UDP-2,3-diacylglucosamine hydrolase